MSNNSENKWIFVPFEKKYQTEHFDCGYEVLNDYLKKYARQNHKKGIAKTFVAISQEKSLRIDGYYTLSSTVIEFDSMPKSYQKKIPKYPIPAILIGKLACNNSVKGKGLGGELLVDALLRIVKASLEIGIFAVRVDAINLKAKEFYLKYEFIPFCDQSLSLFLPIETIIKELV